MCIKILKGIVKYSIDKLAIGVLCCFIALIFITSEGWQVINCPPKSVHQWRQSDCYAYCRTYYERHTGLLEPAIYHLAGNNGRVVSELPIIYYTGAQICRVIGFHPWVFRGLTFLCYVLGLLYLYRCIRLWISDPWLAMFPVLLLATSPYYYYYGLNYLPNVPAISISFIGFYYLLRYSDTRQLRDIITGTLVTALAALLKPTDGGIICIAYTMAQGGLWLSKRTDWKKIPALALSTLTVLLFIFSWYKYVEWYNNVNGNHKNLQGLYPIWRMSKEEIEYVYRERIYGLWSSCYQQEKILYLMKAFLYGFAITFAWQKPLLRWFVLSLIGLTWAYNLCWFMAFSNHDYYQLIDVIVVVFVVVAVLEWYSRTLAHKAPKWLHRTLLVACFGISGVGVWHNQEVQHDRNTKPEYVPFTPLLYEAEPFLRQVGIRKTDTIVSAPDPSTSITLAAFGNRGYSEETNIDLNQYRKMGVRYLIISDTVAFKAIQYGDCHLDTLGVYKSTIYAFRIR
ncbi:MAG: hypothetical protein EBZ77_00635 [Chitinophagia bacterium]|nr:hypothetical protein [Chitinophagia bacterium]